MSLPKRYNPSQTELELIEKWQQAGTYHFKPDSLARVYSLDTPPATVSGNLHLGHTYSYSHPDFIARFWRMRGRNVFYPMGFDDNGLPTGRLVEKQLGIKASQIGRKVFIEKCLQLSEQYGKEYQELWQRLGLSIDWRYTYRTISPESRKVSQLSFLELYKQDLAYQKESPTIWCPECETAIAQADMEDADQASEFVVLKFRFLDDGADQIPTAAYIPIATTRPELLPACVAVFVHPQDERYAGYVGGTAQVPIFEQQVPVLADAMADPQKGTGAVMCCTFGDQTDVAWWNIHNLPLVETIDRAGKMTAAAGGYQGLTIEKARVAIKDTLHKEGNLLSRTPLNHTIRVHERCQTPVEYITTLQWFIRVLDYKDSLLEAGQKVNWVPAHMLSRYTDWVENLNWDWCISRQRYYGVPFPVWYCESCGEIKLAAAEQLPVDPLEVTPNTPCERCGGHSFRPETDVMDTWATSSLTPQIAAGWLRDSDLYQKVTPFSLRPQAHEIIRTWTFYTIAKSKFHFKALPWENILISGWGIAGEGMGKISKSRGGGPMSPMDMIQTYSADAVRYWSASTSPGKDAVISEEKIKNGAKLVNKLWNVARFSAPFFEEDLPTTVPGDLTTADQWALSKLQKVIQQVTAYFEVYDYAAAKAETEAYFWRFADNYIEMAKQRLYNPSSERTGAIYTLHQVLLSVVKLFAPILPFVTEQIYQGVFAAHPDEDTPVLADSVHTSSWPTPEAQLIDDRSEEIGDLLIEIASQVRKYKSERALPLNTEIKRLQLGLADLAISDALQAGIPDLMSITRALHIEITANQGSHLEKIYQNEVLQVAIEP